MVIKKTEWHCLLRQHELDICLTLTIRGKTPEKLVVSSMAIKIFMHVDLYIRSL